MGIGTILDPRDYPAENFLIPLRLLSTHHLSHVGSTALQPSQKEARSNLWACNKQSSHVASWPPYESNVEHVKEPDDVVYDGRNSEPDQCSDVAAPCK